MLLTLRTTKLSISEKLRGRRILVVGGAGSIGAHTTRVMLDYEPAAVHVVDQNENSLVELVRELRGRPDGISSVDFQTLPLDYGSPVMARLLKGVAPYDLVLNFAALKHVRSEKDIYSALQMLDTNIVRHDDSCTGCLSTATAQFTLQCRPTKPPTR